MCNEAAWAFLVSFCLKLPACLAQTVFKSFSDGVPIMDLAKALDGISPLAVATVGLLAVLPLVLFINPFATSSSRQLPLLSSDLGSDEQRRKEFISNPRALYEKGYEQFKDSAFRMLDDFCKYQSIPQHDANAAANSA
jgi:hypothetical protein